MIKTQPDKPSQIEKIEILSVELLNQYRNLVEELDKFAKSVGLEFGWHYLLDLTWIISHLNSDDGKFIMDAGAGTGILQWYLAEQGYKVISADRSSRADLPLRFRKRFNVKGLRPQDLTPAVLAFIRNFKRPIKGPFLRRCLITIKLQMRDLIDYYKKASVSGDIFIYNQDLVDLSAIKDSSLDAVVAVSALEHNTPDGLREVIKEIIRVIKPGGVLLATLTAARDQDYWHEASSAMCYTDTSLRSLFDLSPNTPSNYEQYDKLFEALESCSELRNSLASFYTHSTSKGMPKGIWDPQYQPVGVIKIKHR